MPPPSSKIHVQASCHCTLFNTTISLPLSSFPLKSAICHCNSCRHVTGQLFASHAVIPVPLITDAHGFDKLVKYESSSTTGRYFCPTCGSTVLNVEESEWEFATGILDLVDDDGNSAHELLDEWLLSRGLLFVGDSKDGGAVPWINGGEATGLACRKLGHRDSPDVSDAMLAEMDKSSKLSSRAQEWKLEGKCHCGAVKIELAAPENESERYGAGLCACTSCRKTSGFEFTAWALKVPTNAVKVNGHMLGSDLATLGSYASSENVNRHFCKFCGATISYQKKGTETIDLAPGLFNADEGSRSESFFEWNQDGDNLAYIEDAVDMGFAKKLSRGIRDWTKR